MAERVVVVGGPADGMTTAPGDRFVWLEVVVLKRSERTPAAGLYELRPDGAGYDYVGGHRAQCSCGGSYVRANGSDAGCPLCGARAAA